MIFQYTSEPILVNAGKNENVGYWHIIDTTIFLIYYDSKQT